MSRSYRIIGAIFIILGVLVAFAAAGTLDGGAGIPTLLFLILAAVALLVSGIALIKASEELEWLKDQNDQLFNLLLEPTQSSKNEIDYSIRERKPSCS